jgi:hypothetical protein
VQALRDHEREQHHGREVGMRRKQIRGSHFLPDRAGVLQGDPDTEPGNNTDCGPDGSPDERDCGTLDRVSGSTNGEPHKGGDHETYTVDDHEIRTGSILRGKPG